MLLSPCKQSCHTIIVVFSVTVAINFCLAYPSRHQIDKELETLIRILVNRPERYTIRPVRTSVHRPHGTASGGFTQTKQLLWEPTEIPSWQPRLDWTDQISVPVSILDSDHGKLDFKPVEPFVPQKRDDLGW
ncbi:hypothetical protein D915_004849 [Fasciola hepatica]|uniref:Uncharacterized protein n=1 Tax=Fasciola hepatica TaxID=6192 RepID=A0A4E0R731_FASHE|nr:hypothetical protein D915_004849 [Fasciola hepatica]